MVLSGFTNACLEVPPGNELTLAGVKIKPPDPNEGSSVPLCPLLISYNERIQRRKIFSHKYFIDGRTSDGDLQLVSNFFGTGSTRADLMANRI